jgi:hypothetical protein
MIFVVVVVVVVIVENKLIALNRAKSNCGR